MVWKIDGKTQLTGWKVYLAILVPKIILHHFITSILDWTVAWIAGICHGNSQIILQLNGWEGLASKSNTHFESIWFQALLSLQLQGQIISWIYLNRQRFWHKDKIQCLNFACGTKFALDAKLVYFAPFLSFLLRTRIKRKPIDCTYFWYYIGQILAFSPYCRE